MKKYLRVLIISLIFLLGVFLRLYKFAQVHPFWLDECSLALNILDKNNYFTPLLHIQAAPPFFMYLSKFIYKILPIKAEISLRLVPLFSSLLSLPIFYLFIRKIFVNKISVIISFYLFSINCMLLRYCAEFKQYSSDVLIFLSILTSFLYVDLKSFKTKILYGTLLGILFWFSNASAIAIGCIGIVYIIQKFRDKNIEKNDIALFLPSIFSCGIYYITLNATINNPELHKFWSKYFINYDFSNFNYVINELIKYTFKYNSLIIILLILIGMVKLKQKPLILLPICSLLLLGYMHICPIYGRVVLFIIPILIICISGLCEYKNKIGRYFGAVILTIFVLIPNSLYTYNQIIQKKMYYEDILTPLKMAAAQMNSEDYLITDGNNLSSFNYYIRFFNLNSNQIKILTNIPEDFKKEISNLPKGNYFYVASHSSKKKEWLEALSTLSKELMNCKIYKDKHNNLLMTFTIF